MISPAIAGGFLYTGKSNNGNYLMNITVFMLGVITNYTEEKKARISNATAKNSYVVSYRWNSSGEN